MNIKYLFSFLLLFVLAKGYAQNPKLEEILSLNNQSVSDFQEYMYNNHFLFYKADTDTRTKTDTIVFINKQELMVGLIHTKKGNTVFLKNIGEDYFQYLNQELKQIDFVLVETKIKSKDSLEKKYISKMTGNIIDVFIISDIKTFTNSYALFVTKDPKNKKYKKYLTK